MSFSAFSGPANDITSGLGFATSAGESAIAPNPPRGTSGAGSVKTSPGKYTIQQLEELWVQAGGSAAAAPTAAAIAMAESGGNSNAHNPSGATGLWQILGNPGPGTAWDPLTNAKFAVAKSKNGQTWTPWTTYTSGAYKNFLGEAQKVWNSIKAAGGFTSTAIGGAEATGANAVTNAADWVPNVVSSTFNQAVKDAKYAAVLVGVLVVAVVLITHGVRGEGGPTNRPIPIPV